ncbi:molybdate ABC transporter substrate-binding protein [Vibrio navarrensis]|uniref:molybdate ABC transporter substrate-binding protein n=1 Tax=Vibrio navarrensis TaxID=29495 RepID=UPI001866611B|nr:molybdate ABC transporter substrate-binding protein [Vibrio navarrensis]MBE3666700.1 molybdate ABC transporter substrate-binding protein [Vibrio navarrensis]MBE4579325.1 molybdate ABC transporter substrate-binding protein [Vibrio navarrensis]MBE4597998.1 molybdate ABC transporter substrate-binding protein [Vibrio navarrensis]
MVKKFQYIQCCLALSLFSSAAFSQTLTLAVANNFYGPMKALVSDYKHLNSDEVEISTGSTGQLYAQIINGAPFDLFFSADQHRPQLLMEQQLADDEFTYAQGVLVAWSPAENVDVKAELFSANFQYLAIADPKLAPYGLAAQQMLEKYQKWNDVQNKLVVGKGLNATYQYVFTGNAQIGLLAKSQVYQQGEFQPGSVWQVPASDHQPIKQDAVTLKSAKGKESVTQFVDYLKSERAKNIIASFGYVTD